MLTTACRLAAVDPADVERALGSLPTAAPSDDEDVTRWPVDRLLDYIVTAHHACVRTAQPSSSVPQMPRESR
jgi:iron-sulfur cluster repair protein YtfE (RIC family)